MHTIQSVAEKTGLTPDVIRVWERRYQAISPTRTPANQRLYTDGDIERLALFKQLTDLGLRISSLASLPTETLAQSLQKEQGRQRPASPRPITEAALHEHLDACLAAILEFDNDRLARRLQQALVETGMMAFLVKLAGPLLRRIGDQWQNGNLRTSHEHFASAHLRTVLSRHLMDARTQNGGPRIVIATPPGHSHELGAFMSALIAAQAGWDVIYLGASVPVEELAWCADCKDARLVALSVSYAPDPLATSDHLTRLRQQLDPAIPLIIGGCSAIRYRDAVPGLQLCPEEDFSHFIHLLNEHMAALPAQAAVPT